MTKTIEVRVNDYIGTSGDASLLARIPSINDIAEKAIFDMMKSLPAELVEPHITEVTITGVSPNNVSTALNQDVHVYSVHVGNIAAQYMSPSLFRKSKDTGNYEVTALDPIYTINTDKKIEVMPVNLNFKYHAVVPTAAIVATDILGTDTTVDLTFIPLVAHEAIILDICIKGLQAKLSDLAQDEEDPEMFQVLTAQIQQLQTSYQFEIAKILGPPKEAK
mgnify:CR=1 FL=1